MRFRSFWAGLTAIGVGAATATVTWAESLPAKSAETVANTVEVIEAPPGVESPDTKTDALTDLVQLAITETSKRRLTAGVHTPWQVVHGILALRWDLKLLTNTGEIGAIEWIGGGATFEGQPLWQVTPYGGRGHPFTRPYAFEGHPTQFMGYMSMADIPLDYEFQADRGKITIRDIINDAKMQVRHGPEVTWTLWAISHYEEPDVQWINNVGEPWSIERLLKIQIDEPVLTGACGGTHGLFALCYARNMYISTGKPLRGVWLEADQKIKRYMLEAKTLQNHDGSFSTNHFRGPGYSEDFATRITASGHQLEWLLVALPQSRLSEPWIRKGIESVATDLLKNKHSSSDCGPLYHALHSLIVYRQRTVPGYMNARPKDIVKSVQKRRELRQEALNHPGKLQQSVTATAVRAPVANRAHSEPVVAPAVRAEQAFPAVPSVSAKKVPSKTAATTAKSRITGPELRNVPATAGAEKESQPR